MSMNGYYHPTPEDCGETVELPNPDFLFDLEIEEGNPKRYVYSPKRKVQMVITGPRGRVSIFENCNVDVAGQAIKEFMNEQRIRS